MSETSAAAEVRRTAGLLVRKGKGILAIDESFPTIRRRFEGIGLESTEETRRAYRELLIATPGAAEYVSGMILFDETMRQQTADGTPFPRALEEQGILPGIKVDKGAHALAGRPGEKVTEGLDGLRQRLEEYRSLGARFAKWRAVIALGPGLPSEGCVQSNAHALARYAALCQECGLAPIAEPEVLMDGDHDIARCRRETGRVLNAVFAELRAQKADLEGLLLKTNMIVAGKECPRQAPTAEVAAQTRQCLRDCVPDAVAGVVFLSGGQEAVQATERLNAMNAAENAGEPRLPWPLSFSYGRALQAPCLQQWGGRQENARAAQQALLHRERCNSLACLGRYSAEAERAA